MKQHPQILAKHSIHAINVVNFFLILVTFLRSITFFYFINFFYFKIRLLKISEKTSRNTYGITKNEVISHSRGSLLQLYVILRPQLQEI